MSRSFSTDIRPPGGVLEILKKLRDAGFETWCVGGAVRDALLGEVHLDWDLATAATPPQVRRLFERTIPVGIEFGTVGVLDRRGHMHEVTTFRRDVQHDGRHAVVEFGASLDEDLARRDFTINAMAYDPLSRVLHDPFAGQADLTAGLVRAVGDAESRMVEDRLRALRAIRFAARFDFAIEPGTWRAIVGSAPYLSRLSPERVKQEIEKTMEQAKRPSTAFRRWRDAGAFAALVPPLDHVSESVLDAIDCLPRPGLRTRPQRRILRIAALLSDLEPRDAESCLRALRFSNADVSWVTAIITSWHRHRAMLTAALSGGRALEPQAVRRLAASVGRLHVGAFVRLAAARWASDRSRDATVPDAGTVRTLHRTLWRSAMRDALAVSDLAIDGDDLRRAGVAPGPAMGRVLGALLNEVLDEPSLNTHDALVTRARQLA